ncbi:uncharacterized protein LOC102364529 [Latimeria chalumnae]|uniref:uncharacterized protein LOC102364529 n=1 Tax=Latimeria chalumnae TaxID=7897 RepID=UPI0003C1B221|nr:PREDICTED: uncharacterized protein LOC102364529 [Latimeria chalumnae]|eukprot:XP_006013813.1 PREDICTED: uncharacterized protein LOC102364529 [Latimeria chalumnae]
MKSEEMRLLETALLVTCCLGFFGTVFCKGSPPPCCEGKMLGQEPKQNKVPRSITNFTEVHYEGCHIVKFYEGDTLKFCVPQKKNWKWTECVKTYVKDKTWSCGGRKQNPGKQQPRRDQNDLTIRSTAAVPPNPQQKDTLQREMTEGKVHHTPAVTATLSIQQDMSISAGTVDNVKTAEGLTTGGPETFQGGSSMDPSVVKTTPSVQEHTSVPAGTVDNVKRAEGPTTVVSQSGESSKLPDGPATKTSLVISSTVATSTSPQVSGNDLSPESKVTTTPSHGKDAGGAVVGADNVKSKGMTTVESHSGEDDFRATDGSAAQTSSGVGSTVPSHDSSWSTIAFQEKMHAFNSTYKEYKVAILSLLVITFILVGFLSYKYCRKKKGLFEAHNKATEYITCNNTEV